MTRPKAPDQATPIGDDMADELRSKTAELELTKAALARSEHRLRSVIETARDGIAVIGDDRLLLVNRAFCELLAADESALVGNTLSSVLAQTPVFDTDTEFGDLLSGGELRLRDRQGGERTLECQQIEIGVDGRASTLLILRYVTERQRIEAHMARAQRLATVGMLVSGVAHEINNPLSWVIGSLEYLENKLDDLECKDACRDAMDGAWRMASIVKELRMLEGTNEARDVVRVNDVVAKTIQTAADKIGDRAVLEHRLGELLPVVASEARLEQVLLNLILNASQKMPDRPAAENRISIRTRRDEREVVIEIEDNGRGGANEATFDLGTPVAVNRGVGRTGLGLAISSTLIDLMGGSLEVDSASGKSGSEGRRVLIHLPVHQSSQSETQQRTRDEAEPLGPARPLRILVVDDEPLLVRTLQRVLRPYGVVDIATSGDEAMSMLELDGGYDVIVSDLFMPNGSGRELEAWLERERPQLHARLVFATGLPQADLQIQSSVPLLEKPFDSAVLVRTVLAVARGEHNPSGT